MISFPKQTGRQQSIFYQFPNGKGNGLFYDYGFGYEPEYVTILEYALSKGYLLPTIGIQIKQNALVKYWKITGVWDELDFFHCFLSDGDRTYSIVNWKMPGVNDAIEGANWTYTSLIGFSNGASGTISMMNPSLSANKMQVNDSSFFTDCDLLSSIGNCDVMGAGAAAPRELISTFGSGYISCHDNPEANNTVNINGFLKKRTFSHLSRQTDTFKRYFSDGILRVTTGGATAGALVNGTFQIGGSLGQGRPIATYKCAGAGSSLAGKEYYLWYGWNNYISSI